MLLPQGFVISGNDKNVPSPKQPSFDRYRNPTELFRKNVDPTLAGISPNARDFLRDANRARSLTKAINTSL